MSYVFWCSKCKVDHAGDCSAHATYVRDMIDMLTRQGWKNVVYDKGFVCAEIKLPDPIMFIPITFTVGP